MMLINVNSTALEVFGQESIDELVVRSKGNLTVKNIVTKLLPFEDTGLIFTPLTIKTIKENMFDCIVAPCKRIFLCGPDTMMEKTKTTMMEGGYPESMLCPIDVSSHE